MYKVFGFDNEDVSDIMPESKAKIRGVENTGYLYGETIDSAITSMNKVVEELNDTVELVVLKKSKLIKVMKEFDSTTGDSINSSK